MKKLSLTLLLLMVLSVDAFAWRIIVLDEETQGPIQNASCYLINKYNEQRFFGKTDNDGWCHVPSPLKTAEKPYTVKIVAQGYRSETIPFEPSYQPPETNIYMKRKGFGNKITDGTVSRYYGPDNGIFTVRVKVYDGRTNIPIYGANVRWYHPAGGFQNNGTTNNQGLIELTTHGDISRAFYRKNQITVSASGYSQGRLDNLEFWGHRSVEVVFRLRK